MGQYWYLVSLSRKEYVHPHKLGTGLKLWEQLANHPGTGAALIILCAAMPEPRGGGDFDIEIWRPGPYADIAKRTIGRWAGDRIALVGDYAEDSDLPKKFKASKIYDKCWSEGDRKKPRGAYKDISDDVALVIEHELRGHYEGDGWRQWKDSREESTPAIRPDFVISTRG